MPAAFDLPARDGLRLAADWLAPPTPRAAVLIAPAMGVPRRYYHPFARFLAQDGIAVLIANYRGMDGSDSTPDARLRDWAEQDLAGASDWLLARAPDIPRTWIGHSVGAQLFGVVPDLPFERALFVAGQSGYSGHWPSRRGRLAMRALWWAGVPAFTWMFGRLPMKALRQGEDVPAGVAREWASWGRHPLYIQSYADTLPADGFRAWRGLLRIVSFTDDVYAPPSTARALAAMYRASSPEVVQIAPSDVGMREIGHFGAFRERARDALWTGFRAFANAREIDSPRR